MSLHYEHIKERLTKFHQRPERRIIHFKSGISSQIILRNIAGSYILEHQEINNSLKAALKLAVWPF